MKSLRTALRSPISWVWLAFLWLAAFVSFRSFGQTDGVGHAVSGIGFVLFGMNAFINPVRFNRPVQQLLEDNPHPSGFATAFAAGGPVLIFVGVLLRLG